MLATETGILLELEEFYQLPDGEPFRSGLIVDSPEGCNMSGSGRMLRFVATKGYVDDWALYVHWAESDEAFVRYQGDKVRNPTNIRRCVPCSVDVLERYRY